MDLLNLNYRQLQIEAKKYGIKANQKIDILRLKIIEAAQNVNHSNSGRLHDDALEFINEMKNCNTSTPTFKKFESTLISKCDLSSTDDIDKIYDSNQRNSRFFDDILKSSKENLINSPMIDKVDINQSSNEVVRNLENDNNNNNNVLNDENVYSFEISERKHELNTTFELNDSYLRESKITDDQRRTATIEEKEPACKATSNLPNVLKKGPIKSNLQNITNNDTISKNLSNLSTFRKPVRKTITKDVVNHRKSSYLPNNLQSNPIYKKNTNRQSLLPSVNKPNRLVNSTKQ